MIKFSRISTLSFVSFVLVSGIAAATKLDNNGWPVSIAPTATTINLGESVGFSASINSVSSTATPFTVTSSNPSVLSVPSTVWVPGGDSAVYFTGTTPVIFDEAKTQSPRGTHVTITVTANGRSAQTNVTVQ